MGIMCTALAKSLGRMAMMEGRSRNQALAHVNHHVQGHVMFSVILTPPELGSKHDWKLTFKSLIPDLSIKLCSRHQHYNSKKQIISFQCNVNYFLFLAHLVMKLVWLITLRWGGSNIGAKHNFSAVENNRSRSNN